MKKINFSSFMLLALALVGLTFTSCGDDPVPVVSGCMDVDGDNYDATATEDDGSCLYTGLFLGSYTVTFDCLLIPITSADLIVTRAGDTTLQFIISSEALSLPIPLTANIVSKTMLTAFQDLPPGQDLSELNDQWAGLTWDINLSGAFDRSDDGVISGPITFTLVESSGMVPDPVVDTCTLIATPN